MGAEASVDVRAAMHRNNILAGLRVADLGPGAACERVGPWRCMDAGAPEFSLVNWATIVEPATEADLSFAAVWFEQRGLQPVFELRSDLDAHLIEALERRGYQRSSSMPEMLLTDPEPPAYDGPLAIREVGTADELERYGRMNWSPDLHHIGLAIARNSERLGFSMLLGCLDGEDVAVGASFVTDEMAGVYNVAVRPDLRRRGFGEAITWAVIAAALARGARHACLGASEMGYPVYARMGFETQYEYIKLAAPTG